MQVLQTPCVLLKGRTKGHLHNSLCTCSAGCPDCRQTPRTQQAADLQGLSSKSAQPALHLVRMMHRSTSTCIALPHQFSKAQSNNGNRPASLQHQAKQASTSYDFSNNRTWCFSDAGTHIAVWQCAFNVRLYWCHSHRQQEQCCVCLLHEHNYKYALCTSTTQPARRHMQ